MSFLARQFFPATAAFLFLFVAAPAFAQVGSCGNLEALRSANPQVAQSAQNVASQIGSDFSAFTCKNAANLSEEKRLQGCVLGLCDHSAGQNIECCAPSVGGTEGSAAAAATTAPAAGSNFLRLQLPSCISDGNCQLDDIVRTGVNFANLLFGLSGAVLLATFVYGGVLYLTAGTSGNVSKAKDMIKNALIGMVLVFGAGLLVTTVYDTFRSDTGGGVDACTQRKPGFSCQQLQASPSDAAAMQAEMQQRGCVADLCAGDDTRRCCPENAATQ